MKGVIVMAEEQLVTFSLATEEFGVDIMKVQEIIRIPPITRVPKAPNYVEGVINLRGNVIPVVNLRVRFGMPQEEETELSRIVVLQVNGKVFGVRVDGVTEVLRLDSESIEPPPPVALGMDANFIRGVGKIGERLLILLNLDQLMGGDALNEQTA
jgi:purine-binding chemotaxis protein CheW